MESCSLQKYFYQKQRVHNNNFFKDEDNLKGTSQQYNTGNEQQQNVEKGIKLYNEEKKLLK